jgi:hypothetical protein
LTDAAVLIFVCVTTAPALDGCLAALDRSLPAGTCVLVADDVSGDPRVAPLVQSWCGRTHLSARFLRRDRPYGRARHRGYLIADHPGQDLVVLDGDAVPAPGWLERLQHCAGAHPDIATLSTWSNGACLSSFPRFCEDNPLPSSLDMVAAAAARMGDEELPDLPMAQGPCLYLRGEALRQLGGWDSDSFEALGADADFCHRAASMGWRNALCPTAYVGRSESAPSEPVGEDLRRLAARWPEHQEGLARFLLSDPLRPWREQLLERIAGIADEGRRGGPQGDLFA